ncbi:r2d2 family protein [Megaselia abdita]
MLEPTSSRKSPYPFIIDNDKVDERKRIKLCSYTDLGVFSDSNPVEILRDLCIKKNCPLPTFELVQQTGNYLQPQYIFLCTVSSITRLGTAETKKLAKQEAAKEIITILQSLESVKTSETNDDNLQVTSFETASEDLEEENYRKFKSYRELTESDVKSLYTGRRFSDRYKYFRNFYDELKREAHKVLHSNDNLSQEDKVLNLLRALKLKHKVSSLNMLNNQTFVVFDIVCEIDVVFINSKDKIYTEILEYFQTMLME